MIKIGKDVTGFHVLIYGCPECDGWDTPNQFTINFEHGCWNLTYSPSLKSYADGKLKKIFYCPNCGVELPDLNGWKVTNDHFGIHK